MHSMRLATFGYRITVNDQKRSCRTLFDSFFALFEVVGENDILNAPKGIFAQSDIRDFAFKGSRVKRVIWPTSCTTSHGSVLSIPKLKRFATLIK